MAGYSEELVQLVALAYDEAPYPCKHAGPVSGDSGDWWTCNECVARAVLDALLAAGRLVEEERTDAG